MSSDQLDRLRELADSAEPHSGQSSARTPLIDTSENTPSDGVPPTRVRLERSFASKYLDELIIALLFRCDEANGMDIIREFTHLFGVQFSPGTVYPHLHSLKEEGVLACRECVQTKEYRIDDRRAAQEHLESTVVQLSHLGAFLDIARCDREDGDRMPQDRSESLEEGDGGTRDTVSSEAGRSEEI